MKKILFIVCLMMGCDTAEDRIDHNVDVPCTPEVESIAYKFRSSSK